ncbi:gliding motility-associated peptidyl-prolyl isomerase GldI [Flavobacterium davisii]|uniref:Peptidyl-prolyl cis-trans isomerase n=1 Tax=Flavobacterium columnare TaxID=996 RepID=A0A8G0P652_9FLAO|nr:gliding motility-associated peptidyl-prolyl isomerase GldI [Flavobacterium davisii]QYS88742.1 gliding motility-associated peptidyl-prolyl isomerase GldI [Flavobacterium davisii]
MKRLKIITLIILSMNLVTCCTQKQEARKPISHKTGEFMKQSIDRNKKLNKNEEEIIINIIKKDTTHQYTSSTKGYWYFYNIKNTTQQPKPTKGDLVFFNYEIKDIKGNIIYTQTELKPQTYKVDQQDFIKGLQDGIKLMQKGEQVTFLLPSHLAFGYHGDNNKIGTNQPLICTIILHDIKKKKITKQTLL